MNPLWDTLLGRHERSGAVLLQPDTSYAAFAERATHLAGALRAAGAEPGDRVAMQVEKSPDALALVLACARAGLVALPLNTAYTPEEIGYFVADAEPAVLVCAPGQADALAPVAGSARLLTLGTEGDGTLPEMACPSSLVARAEGDLAAILYTSGTTGRSKGAMLTQANLLSNAAALAAAWRFTEADVLLHALPIFHTHGLFVATNVTLTAGGSMILLPRFDPDAVLDALPRASAMMGVPTFYTRLLDHPGLTREATTHMRLFVSGSAPLLAATHRDWEARTGHRILERYGMTETNMNTSNPYEGERRPGTVGPALPGVEVRIAGADEGGVGGVEVRGPNVFAGYWRMPEKTAEEMSADGWFRTGDLGRLDADGYLTIVGRGKDLIIAGGFNIYPAEVEAVLDALPEVRESAVIGVPHPDLGEGVVAVLVPEPGMRPEPAAVGAAIAPRLARFKQPRRYALVDALPRNAMGKVQKAALRARFAGIFAD